MLKQIGQVWPTVIAAAFIVLLAACAAPGGPRNPDASTKAKDPNQRLALIIGNSKYAESPLVNPVNDARAMASTLTALGFTVTSLYDASLVEMNDAARQFGDKLRAGGVGLFFYAGHGMQIRGRNFLIPVGADIKREEDVQYKSFDANQLLDKMESAKNPINIVILDACRNNPFARSFRSSATGLAQMDAPVGTYVSFSTAPGKVASDGDGANGLFTQHLLGALRTPGQKVEDVFKQVRVRVMQDSGGQQVPWDSSSLTGDFYFLRADQVPPPVAATDVARAQPAAAPSGAQSAREPATGVISPAAALKPAAAASTAPGAAHNASPSGTTPATSRQAARAAAAPAAAAASASAVGAMGAAGAAGAAGAPGAASAASAASSRGGSDEGYRRGVAAQKKGDLATAHQAFAAAAEQGSVAAQYELAMMLKAGRSPVRQDLVQARRWLARAADAGHVASQFELGQLLEQGQGGEKSCKDAEKYLRRAAERAHTDAMLQLGWMNLRGCGGEKNPIEAAKWLKQAAAKGSRDAQFSLGVLYFNGDGVAKDSKEARKLLEAAASKGHPSAKFYLDRLQ